MNPYAPPKATEPPPRRPWTIPRPPDWMRRPAVQAVCIAINTAAAGSSLALSRPAWLVVLNLCGLAYSLVAFAFLSREKASKP